MGIKVLRHIIRTGYLQYGISAAGILLVISLSRALNGLVTLSCVYVLAFTVVAFCACYFGIGPAISATAMAVAGIDYFLPTTSATRNTTADYITLATFVFACAAVASVGEARR